MGIEAGALRAQGNKARYVDWAAFKAGVFFPYDWLQTMAFYDWVNMGLPTFVPDLPIFAFTRGTNHPDEWRATTWNVPRFIFPHHFGDWDNLASRVYWWRLTDFHALPGV